MDSNKTKFTLQSLGLIVSESCNLDCSYCYVSNKSDKKMELETAQNAIKIFMSNRNSLEKVRIDFMGGEPLTAFTLICDICEWVWESQWKDQIYFFITTNGTLLSNKMKQWFSKNRNKIILSLSYDGNFAQVCNRSGINLDLTFFRETWPNQPFKLTITEKSVQYLAEDIISLHKNHILFVATFEMGAPVWSGQNVQTFENQMKQLTDFYCKYPKLNMLQDFDIWLSTMFDSNPYKQHCGMARSFYVVDTKGDTYPCQMMSSLAFSEEELSKIKDNIFIDNTKNTIEGCKDCILDCICPICYSMSMKRFSNPFIREPNICKLFKIEILYICKYIIKMMVIKKKFTYEDIIYTEAVAVILDGLFI